MPTFKERHNTTPKKKQASGRYCPRRVAENVHLWRSPGSENLPGAATYSKDASRHKKFLRAGFLHKDISRYPPVIWVFRQPPRTISHAGGCFNLILREIILNLKKKIRNFVQNLTVSLFAVFEVLGLPPVSRTNTHDKKDKK